MYIMFAKYYLYFPHFYYSTISFSYKSLSYLFLRETYGNRSISNHTPARLHKITRHSTNFISPIQQDRNIKFFGFVGNAAMAWITLCISTKFRISGKCRRNILLFLRTNYFTLHCILSAERENRDFRFMG